MDLNTHKLYYTTILDQVLSINGRFLYACSNYGDIAIYNVGKITNCIEKIGNENISDPISVFKCQEHKPLSLAFHRDFLIVGTDNNKIIGYEVSSTTGMIENISWKIKLPISPEQYDIADVNDMWIDVENETLYAACATTVFKISLEDGKVVQNFEGHKDYIHSVNGYGNMFVTGSEDGTVKLWDKRQKKATNSLQPSKNLNLAQKNMFDKTLLGWIGAATITNDWLACGGGSKAVLFHLTNLNHRTPFHVFEEFPGRVHVMEFINDNLLIAGESKNVMQFSLRGNMVSEMESSGPAVYSVAWQNNPNKFMSLAGASNQIDVSTNFTYKDTTISFYKKEKN